MKDQPAIAYRTGQHYFHAKCWYDWSNSEFVGFNRRYPIDTLYYPGAPQLQKRCHWCKETIKPN